MIVVAILNLLYKKNKGIRETPNLSLKIFSNFQTSPKTREWFWIQPFVASLPVASSIPSFPYPVHQPPSRVTHTPAILFRVPAKAQCTSSAVFSDAILFPYPPFNIQLSKIKINLWFEQGWESAKTQRSDRRYVGFGKFSEKGRNLL